MPIKRLEFKRTKKKKKITFLSFIEKDIMKNKKNLKLL